MNSFNKLRSFMQEITVLYVEDDKSARDELSILLGMLFKKVVVAKNAEEGFLKYQDNKSRDIRIH